VRQLRKCPQLGRFLEACSRSSSVCCGNHELSVGSCRAERLGPAGVLDFFEAFAAGFLPGWGQPIAPPSLSDVDPRWSARAYEQDWRGLFDDIHGPEVAHVASIRIAWS
jgi:hypothetical protein